MTTSPHNVDKTDRWTLIKHYWQHEYTWLWLLPGVLLGFTAGFFIRGEFSASGVMDFIANLMPELFGIALTLSVLYRYEQGRDTRKETARLMGELPRQAKSRSNDRALAAIEEMQERGWLSGAKTLLKGITLHYAKWHEADLRMADLSHSMLISADLAGADLTMANLSGARLLFAKMAYTSLIEANVTNAQLLQVNLDGAQLLSANLSGTFLRETTLVGGRLLNVNLANADLLEATFIGANLKNANLLNAILLTKDRSHSAIFDETTILPDGAHWTPDTDMTRFSDPNHPNFWRSDDPYSPAYRGSKTSE